MEMLHILSYIYRPGGSSGKLDGPGSIPGVGGGGDFSSLLHIQTGPGVHSISFPGGKGGRA